jgi:hypothetical protein
MVHRSKLELDEGLKFFRVARYATLRKHQDISADMNIYVIIAV